MRWPVFAIFAFVLVVMQLSLRNVLTLQSLKQISPDLVACLAVFVCLFAHRTSALWACWALGVAMDLAPTDDDPSYFLIGPHALGYVFGGFLVLQIRTMVFRRKAITIGFMTVVFLLAASILAVFLLAVRSWYPEAQGYPALSEFWRRVLIAVYSGVMAIPLGMLLNSTMTLWGFQSNVSRR